MDLVKDKEFSNNFNLDFNPLIYHEEGMWESYTPNPAATRLISEYREWYTRIFRFEFMDLKVSW